MRRVVGKAKGGRKSKTVSAVLFLSDGGGEVLFFWIDSRHSSWVTSFGCPGIDDCYHTLRWFIYIFESDDWNGETGDGAW
jgi:hypothetical protein